MGSTAVNSLSEEHLHTGDEHGIQGRFQDRIGQVLSAVCRVQQLAPCFADFNCASSPAAYKKTPDAIIMNQSGTAKVVGELKVPWLQSHGIMEMLRKLTVVMKVVSVSQLGK